MVAVEVVGSRLTSRESVSMEFKSCSDSLSRDFWPTYSAFANTFGGVIVLGVDDKTHDIIGVNDPDMIIKEIWDLLNDGRKV
ncbi:MAG: ATP-binding protein, partial [Candidatus Methanomethylophilaceae archaeon]|nr:ATP-binding protein [Candidatus Methanomethylophilaceae archaeon]